MVVNVNDVYQEYFSDVYKYLLTLCKNEDLAEEITQETFFKAVQNIDKFNGTCTLYVWLCQIAKNTFYSYCKKRSRLDADFDMQTLRYGEPTPEDKIINRDMAFSIHRALHNLDAPYKEVFSLRTFGELSFSQIAELFGKTESWARVTYHRAKLKIKEEFQ